MTAHDVTVVEDVGAVTAKPVWRRAWGMVGLALLASISLGAGVTVGYRLGDRTPAADGHAHDLVADFAELGPRLHGVAGIVVAAIDSPDDPIMLGDWRSARLGRRSRSRS